ncbi:unnamed protein product [Phytophthora fragariaefolia]|uniref:Unnamed protein product n=1 Tax=Phytophthora fragariaefolia TaxID=1490495 RepID=A0A9W6U6Q4_9STRA|nr:unnamed protein product [Phytophthora fragariaefolia]
MHCMLASKSNTNVSVGLATGSIASRRKVTIPLSVKFDDFNSVEPFLVLDMDDQYDLILGVPWLAKHELWIDWRSRTIGASHNPLAGRALAGHVPSSSRDGFVHEHRVSRDERQVAGSSEVLALPTTPPPRVWEPEVGDGEDPQDPNTSSKVRQGSAVCNRVAFGQGTVTTQGADASAARAGKGGSVRAPPTQSVAAGSAYVEECAGVVARTNKSGRVGTPTAQGVVAGSARAMEDDGAYACATTSGRAGAPTSKAIRGDKVTSTSKAEASSRDADSAAEDRVPQVLDVFKGEPKVGAVLTPLPTVAELLELEELSYVEVLDSLKAGELAEVVLLRPEGGSLELNSSSVMDSEVLEDERTSRRQTRYGAAILKDPSDSYHPLLKAFSDVVSDDPSSCIFGAKEIPFLGCFLGKDGVRADPEKVCAIAQWPVPVSQKGLRKWLGLANYLHKYSAFYAEMARPLTNLLKKGAVWSWTSEAQQAFEAIKTGLQNAPILALPDEDRPFSVLSGVS